MTLIEAWQAFCNTRGICRIDAAGHISKKNAETGEKNLLSDDVRYCLEAAGFGMGGAEWRRFVHENILENKPEPTTTDKHHARDGLSATAAAFFDGVSPGGGDIDGGIFTSLTPAIEPTVQSRKSNAKSIINEFF